MSNVQGPQGMVQQPPTSGPYNQTMSAATLPSNIFSPSANPINPAASAPPMDGAYNSATLGWQVNTISREISNNEANAPPPSYSEVVGSNFKN